MMVAVDTLYMASRLRFTGTGQYISRLLQAMVKLTARDGRDLRFHAFTHPAENWADNGYVTPTLHVHRVAALGYPRAWMLGGMAFCAARIRPDLIFVPTAQSTISHPGLPLVCTILDAMPARLPAHLIEAGRGAHLATWINAKLATKILTISEWSKKDLVELYGLAPDKVKVTYLGFDRSIFNESVPDYEASVSLLKRLGITRPFLVHHGMIQLRKNLDRLIRSWDLLRRRYRDLDVQLVLAGSMGKGHQQILAAREATAYPQDVIFTDALPNHELGVLLKNASLCVIPSLYEGFCLPLIEAMACGVPTVASKSSCLPEISGKSLEYFDPYSVEDMADVIQRTLDDGDLQQRLRRKGLARAAEFSWERCARETLDTFEQSA